jgi:hypothetical protein
VIPLPSGLPDAVGDDEDLAKFLTSSSQFNAATVKPSAFMPSTRTGETSVFRHGEVPREILWQIADENVGCNRTIYGAAVVKAKHIRAALLQVNSSEPPPRHANITGWPWSSADPEFGKAEQKARALATLCNSRNWFGADQ